MRMRNLLRLYFWAFSMNYQHNCTGSGSARIESEEKAKVNTRINSICHKIAFYSSSFWIFGREGNFWFQLLAVLHISRPVLLCWQKVGPISSKGGGWLLFSSCCNFWAIKREIVPDLHQWRQRYEYNSSDFVKIWTLEFRFQSHQMALLSFSTPCNSTELHVIIV